MQTISRRPLLTSALAGLAVVAVLVTPALASFSWQGRVGQRSWSLRNPGSNVYEITVTWTKPASDLDILVCESPNLGVCRNNGNRVWARGISTEKRFERVVFGNFGRSTLYFHVFRAAGPNTKAVVIISNVTDGLSGPGFELAEIASEPNAAPVGKPGSNP